MNTIIVLILCTSSGSYGQACITRDYLRMDDCKAFVASAEALTEGKSHMKAMHGVCVPSAKGTP
jgi:hypothetical protein